MFPTDALYSHYSDELARQAEITIETGTAEDTYGVERLVDDNPAHLFKANEDQVALQFTFAEKTVIGLLALIHSTLESDDEVVLEADDAADWVTPAFSAAFAQTGWVGAGVTRWPHNSWMRPDQEAGYDPTGYLNYRLTFGLDTPLAQNLQLGQIRMHPTARSIYFDRGARRMRDKPNIENRTAFRVSTIYPRGTTLYSKSLAISALDSTQVVALETQWEDVDGRTYPWLWIPDASDPRCYLVRHQTTQEEFERVVRATSVRPLQIEEVGRGLRPGGPAHELT